VLPLFGLGAWRERESGGKPPHSKAAFGPRGLPRLCGAVILPTESAIFPLTIPRLSSKLMPVKMETTERQEQESESRERRAEIIYVCHYVSSGGSLRVWDWDKMAQWNSKT
jgi:hypothetical protein